MSENENTAPKKTAADRLHNAYNLALQADDELRALRADLRREPSETIGTMLDLSQAMLEQASTNITWLLEAWAERRNRYP